jgi:flagellar basal-body rod modification protein FlgD
MTTAPTTTPSTTGTTSASKTTLENPSSVLGKDDFLRLLVTQLKYQDPLKPTDQSQFMSQMAQFSTVEGISNLGKTLDTMNQSSAVSQAVGLIGKQVTYLQADGTSSTGLAGSVSLLDGSLTIHVGGDDVALADVLTVAGAPTGSAGA